MEASVLRCWGLGNWKSAIAIEEQETEIFIVPEGNKIQYKLVAIDLPCCEQAKATKQLAVYKQIKYKTYEKLGVRDSAEERRMKYMDNPNCGWAEK
ncbi:MAG TPA: hypothetical protein VGR89_16660 [Puia sp.]|nr:hypothetical protein [Puia sp.]